MRTRLRTLIVDDEPLARDGLVLALRGHDSVEVAGSCGDGPSAVTAIRELEPDLVLLDIRMPGLDGFEVIEAVGPERMPAVVFLTAHEAFALDAFRVNAIDYLLKPVDAGLLRSAVERAKRRCLQDDMLARAQQLRGLLDSVGAAGGPPQSPPHRVAVRSAGRVHLVDPAEILWAGADGDYVTLHAAGKRHSIRTSLKAIEAQLVPYGFARIHRSSLVNLHCVAELVPQDSGDYRIVLHDGTVLRMSRSYRDALFDALRMSP